MFDYLTQNQLIMYSKRQTYTVDASDISMWAQRVWKVKIVQTSFLGLWGRFVDSLAHTFP